MAIISRICIKRAAFNASVSLVYKWNVSQFAQYQFRTLNLVIVSRISIKRPAFQWRRKPCIQKGCKPLRAGSIQNTWTNVQARNREAGKRGSKTSKQMVTWQAIYRSSTCYPANDVCQSTPEGFGGRFHRTSVLKASRIAPCLHRVFSVFRPRFGANPA